MYAKNVIRHLRKQLNELFDSPIQQVARKSGKSRPTVSRFFRFHKIKPSNEAKIYDACIALIEQKVNECKSNAQKMMSLSDELEDNGQIIS